MGTQFLPSTAYGENGSSSTRDSRLAALQRPDSVLQAHGLPEIMRMNSSRNQMICGRSQPKMPHGFYVDIKDLKTAFVCSSLTLTSSF